ncbi:MAG: putative metal-binding motif-containing protein, partial [Deltaproteobacteria bacterium]|nr:putative metal-binding motif-containing protein [Deltaproteobacteria bacterium]
GGDAPEPKAEACDGVDSDCDGSIDEGLRGCCACGNGECQAGCGENEGSCPKDCTVCGNGQCDPGEGPLVCPEDCCGGCGDGVCTGYGCGEDPASCPEDCGSVCGNKTCDKGESPQTCPDDCAWKACGNGVCEPEDGGPAECPQDCGATCGDCTCEKGEDWHGCPVDCGFCGDGVCSACAGLGEDPASCPKDCAYGAEVCNGKDDDQDGETDEEDAGGCLRFHRDFDADGAGDPEGWRCLCGPKGIWSATAGGDCDDENPFVLPGAAEACDHQDNDCDGAADEGLGETTCGKGLCLHTVPACVGGVPSPCDPFEGAGAERCNDLDDDCDGVVDEWFPELGLVCTHGTGACKVWGVYRCRPDGSATECDAMPVAPTDERCNGADDDCDGATDEGWPDKAGVCLVGAGACRAAGVRRCTADGAGLECSVEPGEPAAEACDGIDNDCDDDIDEDFPDKGKACSAGDGECHANGVMTCLADGSALACDAVPGEPAPADLCDGRDDDCDGTTDEDFPDKGTVCFAGEGVCRRSGTLRCAAGGAALECTAVPATPADADLCDGRDDDCDGATDEDFPDKGTVCFAGEGVCRRSGTLRCAAGGAALECTAVPATPADADLCDGRDDDCDGATDEDFPDKGTVCSTGEGDCRRSGTLQCASGGSALACTAVPATPAGADRCDGRDDDCDGATDEDFPQKGAVCTAGTGTCRRSGTWRCAASGAALECGAEQGLPSAEVCDYLDNDCDGATDDGFVDGAGRYVRHTACGNCFMDCAAVFGLPGAYGECDASPATPTCRMRCKDGRFDLNRVAGDGCEFERDLDAVYVSGDDDEANDL